jgi:hypothetical protein
MAARNDQDRFDAEKTPSTQALAKFCQHFAVIAAARA